MLKNLICVKIHHSPKHNKQEAERYRGNYNLQQFPNANKRKSNEK